jgi:hypothetical protein
LPVLLRYPDVPGICFGGLSSELTPGRETDRAGLRARGIDRHEVGEARIERAGALLLPTLMLHVEVHRRVQVDLIRRVLADHVRRVLIDHVRRVLIDHVRRVLVNHVWRVLVDHVRRVLVDHVRWVLVLVVRDHVALIHREVRVVLVRIGQYLRQVLEMLNQWVLRRYRSVVRNMLTVQ